MNPYGLIAIPNAEHATKKMMHPFVAESVEKLWDTWNIRGLIILSLLVQSFLILCAPLRRQRRNTWLGISIWLAYLLADWVATFTIGLMLSAEVSDILAFWAPFLLLHLGGPDTITSFSLEDNEFWIRHLLGLMLQVGSTVYLVLQSLPDNKLWLPTLLVLIAGIIKYAERNRAFYLASFDHFKVKQNNPQERCFSLRDFKEDKVWLFILEEVKKKAESAKTVEQGIQISSKRGDGILDSRREYRDLIWSVRNLDYMESLLTWHIATEVCFQFKECADDRPMSSENMDCREISKLISDYMFCVLMGPAITTNNHRAIFSKEREPGWLKPPVSGEKVSAFVFARILAFQLKQLRFPWKIMSQVWVEIMCYAAINCRPNVHAQQPRRGGQLLTFVWLLMNYLGLGSQFETEPDDIGDWNESTIPSDIGHGHEPTNPNELLLLLLYQRRSVEDPKF
ncbi:hypothetical protein SLEP1_g54150 [Rubroshorea leprosula]|uniref:DUF4220 domain-containing protein n=1 Tax=Rubroshorea leprosula TaxID=152421 RepID=A0AAV5MFI2_9ROSI|nr:hypothetical protein SLEP1_g54150 [Rubroshorea leprosula]